MVPIQAYADLLKASWILIDIISKHPQQRFWSPTSEFLQVQLIVEVRCSCNPYACLQIEKSGICEDITAISFIVCSDIIS
jgi:hypothetical protein